MSSMDQIMISKDSNNALVSVLVPVYGVLSIS